MQHQSLPMMMTQSRSSAVNRTMTETNLRHFVIELRKQ